jgi:ABC-type multidrug transport system ATPase subunit
MLQLTKVSLTYPGGIKALQDISVDIPPGMFGLLGPNGAGKSTLMRTIATLQTPGAGAIDFAGIDVLKNKTGLRRVLGYLPQEFGAYPRTSAELMLRHFAALKGIHGTQQKQVVDELLVRTNLWDARLPRHPGLRTAPACRLPAVLGRGAAVLRAAPADDYRDRCQHQRQ